MWLNEFKIALISQDIDKMTLLLAKMPQFSSLQEMEEVFYLFKQAEKLLHELKDETALAMKKLKDTICYIESTHTNSSSKLDIIQ
jgi:hypothetical protein